MKNREIKFRGKRVDNGEWVYGSYLEWTDSRDIKHYEICTKNGHNNEVIPETVGYKELDSMCKEWGE